MVHPGRLPRVYNRSVPRVYNRVYIGCVPRVCTGVYPGCTSGVYPKGVPQVYIPRVYLRVGIPMCTSGWVSHGCTTVGMVGIPWVYNGGYGGCT